MLDAGLPPFGCGTAGLVPRRQRRQKGPGRDAAVVATWLLKQSPQSDVSAKAVVKQREKEKEPEGADRILCRVCRQWITAVSERIEMNGAHQHTCANPAGYMYTIGCFRRATGCLYVGPPTAEWSWFPGYAWSIAACGNCGSHLGWLFTASDSAVFHGFIVDRLAMEQDEGGDDGP